MAGIRDLIAAIAHTPFKSGDPSFPTVSGKLLNVFGMSIDGLIEKADQGVKARIPTLCDASALQYIGNDRVIPRGPNEPEASYRIRLQRAYDTWAMAGNSRTVLGQVLPVAAPLTPRIRTVDDSSGWYTYEDGADTSQPPDFAPGVIAGRGEWDWDGHPSTFDSHPVGKQAWWRYWLVIYATDGWIGKAPKCGSGMKCGDKSISCGLNAPSAIMKGVQSIVAKWQRKGAWCRWIVISFDDALFDPGLTADGTHNPAGTFGPWAAPVGGAYVPTRFANARYCDGAI
jgi:hypothetical protein